MSRTASDLRLDEASLREPLRRVLGSRQARRMEPGARIVAAVLVPLFERGGEVHVQLVRRPESMRNHGGQVAFPGGKNDPVDESLRATALREAEEELGIGRSSVDVLGALDDYPTSTGYVVTPWVGWLSGDPTLRPNPSEVARAFAPPLRAFLRPPEGFLPWDGWTVEGERVWGATAAMLRGLVSILRAL
jgi:8-oxo-dGTP pyrophosphatase MutT (NUDIX family)